MTIRPGRDGLAHIRTALAGAAPGSPQIKIGVVDGLPDLRHPSLRDASIEILSAMVPPDSGSPDDHGTKICSLIFGRGHGVNGLASSCSGLVLPVFFREAAAEGQARPVSQLDLARAISFGLERGVAVINISAGQKSATNETESYLDQVLQQSLERRVLVIAAAGNDGCACIHIPAAVDFVLSVGAVDASGRPLEMSNWAEAYRRNGLLAPGEDLLVAVPGGGITTGTGTSFATAVVSSVAALLLSIARREGYRLDPIDIRQVLIESATPCELEGEGACDRYLAGTLDSAAALALVHRTGNAGRSFVAPHAKERGPPQANQVREPIVQLTRGEFAMSESKTSEAAVLEPAGVLPSACSREQKPDESTATTGLKPQSDSVLPAALAPIVQSSTPSAGLTQQACSCGKGGACTCGGGQPPQIVFAIGALWFDFGTEARYDAFVQQQGLSDPITPEGLFGFLRDNPEFLSGLTFILMQGQVPIYAITPAGPFAQKAYDKMLATLRSSIEADPDDVQRASIPGFISGSTRLMNGMTVPVIFPDARGMYTWKSEELIAAAKKGVGKSPPDETLRNYLHRIYYELRNLGVTPQERALNYAATNAYQAANAFSNSVLAGFVLDDITVAKSPICRPDSDCWDIVLTMFDPENQNRPNVVYRFTVDVSEVLPVTVGDPRWWYARAD
jgi:cyanobactin maturation PatA/PatG family protease